VGHKVADRIRRERTLRERGERKASVKPCTGGTKSQEKGRTERKKAFKQTSG